MPKRTSNYNSWQLEKLLNPETAAAYLSAAISDSPEMFRKALRNVAQARQMAKVAREAGVTRESLYRATSDIGNPTLDTLASVFKVLDLQMIIQPRTPSAVVPAPVPAAKRATYVFVSRQAASLKRTKTRGLSAAAAGQMSFDFTSSTVASPVPAVQQSAGVRNILETAGNSGSKTFLPPYLSNIMLERNYGYPRAFNASEHIT
jgi:probable addiction module antidote protein